VGVADFVACRPELRSSPAKSWQGLPGQISIKVEFKSGMWRRCGMQALARFKIFALVPALFKAGNIVHQ